MGRVFANGPGDRGSIPGRVIPKTQKMVLDVTWLDTQHYKVRIKGKLEQSSVVAIEKGAFGSPSTQVGNFTFIYVKNNHKFSTKHQKYILTSLQVEI